MISDWRQLQAILDQDYQPDPTAAVPQAAVAATFRFQDPEVGTELLFIQRASRDNDPWSGQMAFPGGRREPIDRSPRHTATRETSEEVGLDLRPARYLGTLTELDGGRATNRPIVVSAHAWWLDGPPPSLTPNEEVADTVWVPLSALVDEDRHIDYLYPRAGSVFPGIQLDQPDQVIWGLTLRFLHDLFHRLDQRFIQLD